MAETQNSGTFARRVRDLLEGKRVSLSELAEKSELAPSLVSKLLTETESARREPRLEHVLVIARVLEMPPGELVAGTDAESLLGEWVPRTEFEAESKARITAQADSAKLRTELAGTTAEAKALRNNVEQLSRSLDDATKKLAEVEARARREAGTLRVARDAAESKFQAAMTERDQAWEQARTNYLAWANANSRVQHLQRELVEAKEVGWLKTLVGTVGGAIVGAAAADPGTSSAPRRTTSRRTTRKRRA